MQFTDRDLHIVPGLSPGGILHRLGMAWSNMCVAEDDLSRGPLMSPEDPNVFRRLRRQYWRKDDDLDPDERRGAHIPFIALGALDGSADRVRSTERIFLWLGTTLLDQLVLAWVVSLFKALDIGTSALRFLELRSTNPNSERSIGMLDVGDIRKMARWRSPAEDELASYECAWRANAPGGP